MTIGMVYLLGVVVSCPYYWAASKLQDIPFGLQVYGVALDSLAWPINLLAFPVKLLGVLGAVVYYWFNFKD